MKRSKSVNLVVVPLIAAAFLSGCGGEEETAYCVDENDVVVENRHCESGTNGGFFWFFGGAGLGRGSIAGPGERINSTDKAALARRGGFGANGRSTSSGSGVGTKVSTGGGFSGGG